MPIYFINPGELEPAAFSLMGVSVKSSSSPIGHFGTGLKYAIAGILRAGGSISIDIGLTRWDFQSTPISFRGTSIQRVQAITNHGLDQIQVIIDLPFSLDYGRDWSPWQFFRELYSNALDEGGLCTDTPIQPAAGSTRIVVRNFPAFELAYQQRDTYFLPSTSTPLYAGKMFSIYTKTATAGDAVYYRGVAVAQMNEKPSLFTYNFHNGITLSEDRSISQHWFPILLERIGTEVMYNAPTAIQRKFLEAPTSSYEGQIPYDRLGLYLDPPENFLATIRSYVDSGHSEKVNIKALRHYFKLMKQEGSLYSDHPLTTSEAAQVLNATRIVEAHFRTPLPEIRYVTSLPDGALGLVVDGQIYISADNFNYGTTMLVGTLFEEYVHLNQGLADESRQFQEYLIKTISRLLVNTSDPS